MLSLRYSVLKADLIRNTLLRLHSTSIETVSKQTERNYDKELKQFETLSNITKRTREKKPQRPPFVKNLLIGKFDTEVLVFPQLENDELQNLDRDVSILKNLLKQKHMVNVNSLGNKEFRQNLSDVRSIGLQASQFLDGRESTPMEVMKFLETFAEHNLGDNIIYNEQLCVQTLVKYSSDPLQKKYLFPVIKGDKLLAYCFNENKFNDLSSMETKATLTKDAKYWKLTGEKTYVVNGVSADYLIIFAVTNVVYSEDNTETQITGFLVEKDLPGVSYTKLEGSGSEMAKFVFQDVQIPIENVIGEVHKGEMIVIDIIKDFRLSCGAACSTLTRSMLNKLLQTILDQSADDVTLYKAEIVRHKLGEIAMNLYAAESVSYLTAGLQDWYEHHDTIIESSIVKILSSEVAYKTSTACLDSVGLPAAFRDHWARQYHEKVLGYITLHETSESQKLIIALMGLQYAGIELSEKIRKIRNPLFNGTFTLIRGWTNRKNVADEPSLDLELFGFLHPSLGEASNNLEYCIKRLQFATEIILSLHGLEVLNKHVDLCRLAEVMIDCYAMTAVLARASRSYCIGLQNSNFDMVLASNYCHLAKKRVQENVRALYSTIEKMSDKNIYDVGKQLTKSREYFIQNPLSRNF